MPDFPKRLVIGTRASALALWQANHVKALLEAQFNILVRIQKITTKGDQILDRSLVAIGGKGLFLKEIEDALLAGQVDLAVHSMKDVPYDLPQGLCLAAMLEREDPRDAFIGRTPQTQLGDLPTGAVIGTTSLRRVAQLQARFPALVCKDLRGNVDTRLAKLAKGEFDGIVLAHAGLKRLGLQKHVSQVLDFVPAVGQGAIGIECREDDVQIRDLLSKLNHAATQTCVDLERAFLRAIQGDCKTPVGCHAEFLYTKTDMLRVRCFYQPHQKFSFEGECALSAAPALVADLAQRALRV